MLGLCLYRIQYGAQSQAGFNNIRQRRHYMEIYAAFTLSINHFASRYSTLYFITQCTLYVSGQKFIHMRVPRVYIV